MTDTAQPGGLIVSIDDRSTHVAMIGGGSWTAPIGPLSLVEGELERADRPHPAQLTNALGIVTDHLDDIILDAPIVAAAPSIVFTGPHAAEFARVELGAIDVPDDYTLQRRDADEVFRTLVAETVEERLDNPGLDSEHVESIIGTCCVILAVIRRLDLPLATIRPDAGSTS